MSELTVVIPTLCKSHDLLQYTLNELYKCEVVKTILVFDNTCGSFQLSHPKMQVFNTENLYVNPAWNKGLELCATPYYLLLNDDVLCASSVVSACVDILKSDSQLQLVTVATKPIAQLEDAIESYKTTVKSFENIKPIYTIQGTTYTPGCIHFYGWFICGKVSSWIPIPKDLLVYYGDTLTYFRHDNNDPKIGYLSNYLIYHRVSTTVNQTPTHWRLGHERPFYITEMKNLKKEHCYEK